MGSFIYDTLAHSVEIDDRTLAHLRIVVMNKLRRSEPFMFDVEMRDGSGRRAFWINPSVGMQFRFYANRLPSINRVWVEQLMQAASGPNGLTLLPEPGEPVDSIPANRHSGEHPHVAANAGGASASQR